MAWNYEYWKTGRVIAKRNNKGKFIKGHRHLPKEIKKKISESLIGVSLNEERKRKISISIKEKFSKDDFRRKQSKRMKKYYKYNPQESRSEDHKRKISLTMTGRKYSKSRRENISKGKKRYFENKENCRKLSESIKLWWKNRRDIK